MAYFTRYQMFLRMPVFKIWALFFMVSGLLFGVALPGQASDGFVARQGVLDLRAWDAETSVALKGEWAFFWKELLRPKELDVKAFPPDETHALDELWNDTPWRGEVLSGQGFATYALQIKMPKTGTPLALSIPDSYSAYRLWLNGEVVAKNGKVGRSKVNYYPFWLPITREVKLQAGPNQLVIQIANFDHYKGGLNRPLLLGPAKQMLQDNQRSYFADSLVSGALFMGGFFFLGLFMFGKHDKAVFYFAIFCLCFSYRIVGSGFYVLHNFLPESSWHLAIRLEYLTLFFAVWVFNQFLKHVYPDENIGFIQKFIAYFSLFFTFITLILPPYYFTQVILFFNLTLLTFFLPYSCVVFCRAALAKRPGAYYGILSMLTLLITVTIQILSYMKLVADIPFSFVVGCFFFFFFQSLILSFRFAESFRQAEVKALSGVQAKSYFLATMSHELRTPMNVVIGMTELLQATALSKEQREYIDVIHQSGDNLLAIISDILDYSRLESKEIQFHVEPVQLAILLKEVEMVLRPLAIKKGLAFKVDSDMPESVWFLLDATRFKQVLINLLNNAIKFTEKGQVSLILKTEQTADGNWELKGEVKDSGIGIPLEAQAKLFQDFYQVDGSNQRKFGGSGLGLAITRGILIGMEGSISVQSVPNEGSSFYFSLPLEKTSAPLQPIESEPLSEQLQLELRVLVVDDNEMNRLMAEAMFAKLGYSIVLAVNGKDALMKIEAQTFDLIFMDLQMPEMNGLEATEIICQKEGHPIVIAMTANVLESNMADCFTAGMSDFLAKPFKQNDLLNMLNMWAPQIQSRE